MKKISTQYIISLVILAFALYQLTLPDYWEFSLYFFAGLSFLVMGMIKSKNFDKYLKVLTILSWILIILTGFLFLFMVRTDG